MSLNDKLFKLLRVAIGSSEELPQRLTDEEWDSLYADCQQQDIAGIAFVGIQRLPREQQPPQDLLAEWEFEAREIAKKNEILNKRYREICGSIETQGYNCCVLSSVSIPNENSELSAYRNTEDIDILCWTKEKDDSQSGLMEYVNFRYVSSSRHIKPKIVRQPVDWSSESFPVDVRFKISYFNSPLYDRRFQKWMEKEENFVSKQNDERGGSVPSNTFNAVYQLVHLYRRLFCEGIRLGHLVEYYYILRELSVERLKVRAGSLEGRDEKVEIMRVIEHFGMRKFAGAVMYVMQRVFGLPDEYLLCKPNPRNGSFVLNMTLLAGNYSENIKRTRWFRRFGRIGYYFFWLKRNRPFLTQYPAEVCFELYRRMKG